MPISAKRKLVAGATGLVVLAGTGGAYAATQSSTPSPTKTKAAARIDQGAEQKAFLDDLAKRLNVTRDQLDTAIKGAADARIDAAVAAGKLTKEQGEAMKKRLAAGAPLLRPGPLGLGRPHGGTFGRPLGLGFRLDEAADYLGLTRQQLHEQLRNGKSLADVAKAQNKSVDGLKTALKNALTAQLDKAVKDKRLTEAQKTKILADVDARLDEVVNNTGPRGGPGLKRRWR
jgi:hypothetical protein